MNLLYIRWARPVFGVGLLFAAFIGHVLLGMIFIISISGGVTYYVTSIGRLRLLLLSLLTLQSDIVPVEINPACLLLQATLRVTNRVPAAPFLLFGEIFTFFFLCSSVPIIFRSYVSALSLHHRVSDDFVPRVCIT